jgi:hypothetical protein
MAIGFPPVIYVCFYNCIGWNSSVAVMNLQGVGARFLISVFEQGGPLHWSDAYDLKPRETKIIPLDRYAPKERGMVVVCPDRDEHEGFEFPSVLGIAVEGAKEPTEFVPFIRMWRE